ncbi:hypothetical protein [Streptomyces sp. NPDC059080]|uniref:hypothetical protein n=1 Tax=Streptomyces sp. NPDC059080 TaxID=3346718 RepID=UPI0036AA39AE
MHEPTPDPPPQRPHQPLPGETGGPPPDGSGTPDGPRAPVAPDDATEPEAGPGPVSPAAAEPGPAADAPPEPEESAAPQPLGVTLTPTGEPAVDTPLSRLADADHLAVGAHLAVYEDVHRGLRDALAALDGQPGPPASTHDTPTHDIRS